MNTRNNRKRKFEAIDTTNFISATGIVNYIHQDPILDYLDIVDKNNKMIVLNNNNLTITEKPEKKHKRVKTALDYIFEEGNLFETTILDKIKKYMKIQKKGNKIITMSKCNNKDFHFLETKKIIEEKKYDVILNGCLIDYENTTQGLPDMIVSGKWIKYFIHQLPDIEIKNDMYYIIDIKSSTIMLKKDGFTVASNMLFQGYKAQIWVYKEALDKIQGCDSKYSFILGKKYMCKNETLYNSFGKLGLIDYKSELLNGNDISTKVKDAINWKNYVRENWENIKLSPINKQIRPNMKNMFDKKHNKTKQMIAQINGEITSLWYCGIPQRTIANKHKIYKYTDNKLTAEKMGFSENSSKNTIINNMLELSKSNELIRIPNKNNCNQWRTKYECEFFVDFETYTPSYDEYFINEYNETVIEQLQFNVNYQPPLEQKIYMIGVSHFDKEYIFKCFIIDYKGSNELYSKIKEKYNCSIENIIKVPNEKTLIIQFVNYILSFNIDRVTSQQFYQKTRLIHWSMAEPNLFLKKTLIYNLSSIKYKLPWYDLMTIFKEPFYPIIIKNCFKFSLKYIVKAMHNHKLIDLEWPELDDGLLSMFMAKDVYKNSDNINVNNKNMKNIVEYNFIDCKALFVILDYLRNNASKNKNKK
jgi:hypothetical protein